MYQAAGEQWTGHVRRGALLIAGVGLLGLAAFFGEEISALVAHASSQDRIMASAAQAGPWIIVAVLALAIVVSPIPSGPVALAAGALYGPFEGGALTVLGAFAGAMIAFAISRHLGAGPMRRSTRPLAVWIAKPRSQTALMLIVLVSRCVPFISFDAVSYLAGLTRLRAWRFALATLLGVMPVSFAFAAMGHGMSAGGPGLMIGIACGITLLLPLGESLRRLIRGRRVALEAPQRLTRGALRA